VREYKESLSGPTTGAMCFTETDSNIKGSISLVPVNLGEVSLGVTVVGDVFDDIDPIGSEIAR
jgi:hypothetical protein